MLDPQTTALLVIDIQNTYLEDKDTPEETARWQPFFERMNRTVTPNTADLIEDARSRGVEVMFARIACQKEDGRDRSLSQKNPGLTISFCPRNAKTVSSCQHLHRKMTKSRCSRRRIPRSLVPFCASFCTIWGSRRSCASVFLRINACHLLSAALLTKASMSLSLKIAAPLRQTSCTCTNSP